MTKVYIVLIFITFFATCASAAHADQAQISSHPVREQAVDTSSMNDEALASYITGRLKQALKNDDYKVEQYCDNSGCSVVVQ